MKATLKDVAAAANVGLSTASYVLNGSGLHKVGTETRERILAAAAQLNYTPNAIARGLRSGKSYLIGVLLPGIDYSFMPEIIAGIDRVLSEHKYNMLLCTFSNPDEIPDKLQILKQKQVDGIIVKAWSPECIERIAAICANRLPCVLTAMPDCAGLPAVQVDPELLGKMSLAYLRENNHRNIAMVVRKNKSLWLQNVSLAARQYSDIKITEFNTGEPDWQENFFARHKEFSAAVCCDPVAVNIIHEANLRNINIPGELSVLGADGLDMGAYTTPGLTTIAQPRSEQGSVAAELLLQWISSGQKPSGRKLKPELCLRQSVATLKK